MTPYLSHSPRIHFLTKFSVFCDLLGLRPGKPEVVKVDGLRITLTWAAPITAAANQSYDLQYGAHGRHEVTHKVVSGNRTTVDLKPTTRYTIRVKTSGSGADGRWSDVLRIRSNESRELGPGLAAMAIVRLRWSRFSAISVSGDAVVVTRAMSRGAHARDLENFEKYSLCFSNRREHSPLLNRKISFPSSGGLFPS